MVTGVLNLKGLQQSIPLASVTLTAEGTRNKSNLCAYS